MLPLQGILTTLLLAFCLSAQSEPVVEPVHGRAARTLAEAQCQTSLPGDPEEPVAGSAAPQRSVRGRKRPGDLPSVRLVVVPAPALLAEFLLWLALAVAVAVLLVVIARALRGRTEVADGKAVLRATAVPPEPVPEQVGPDHARLANDGHFGPAIHALLREALATGRRWLVGLPEHATGRDAVRRASQQRLPTAALAAIVRAVEWHHFGGRLAERSHYEDAVRHFAQWEAQCKTTT